MAVRPSLNHKPAPREAEPPTSAPPSNASSVEAKRRPRSAAEGYRPPSRQGKRAAVPWLEPEAIKQLNMHAIQHDRNVQDILVEAISESPAPSNIVALRWGYRTVCSVRLRIP